MDRVKPLLLSKTFWGALIAVVAGVLGLFGYALTPADQAWLVDAIANLAALFGGAIAIYGRISATKRIG